MIVLEKEPLAALRAGFTHVVWVKQDGVIFSDSAQAQRDEIAEWFVRFGMYEEDVDSVYCRRVGDTLHIGHRDGPVYMVFGFQDPNKAMQFKLAWG